MDGPGEDRREGSEKGDGGLCALSSTTGGVVTIGRLCFGGGGGGSSTCIAASE